MAKTKALIDGLVEDSILVEVISAFMERTRGVPEELQNSLSLAKVRFDSPLFSLALIFDQSFLWLYDLTTPGNAKSRP